MMSAVQNNVPVRLVARVAADVLEDARVDLIADRGVLEVFALQDPVEVVQ